MGQFLKNYQQRVVGELKTFFETASTTKEAIEAARKALPENLRGALNWVSTTFDSLTIPLHDKPINGLGDHYPRVVLKVPTGGGKTLLAVEAIREYQNLFAKKNRGLVVWIVPSETIYSQTVKRLKDKSHFLRQLIDQSSGGKTLIMEKGQKLTANDIEENLVILFIMIQSVNRAGTKESLKVFQDSGGYDAFFPDDSRYDLHEKLLEQFPNLDHFDVMGQRSVKTSLGNAMRLCRPLIIIDEMHKVFTDTAKKTIDALNPSMVLGLSATPKEGMNILSRVTGVELKEEEMIKLDLHIKKPSSSAENDWKGMLREIKKHREKLEDTAIAYKNNNGVYIRPIALIQVEATGKDQRGKGNVHSLDVFDYLKELEINPDQIAIKTSSQNDIEDVDLLSSQCEIRYIITKEALKEGWDNPFAYCLGIIPNANSNSSMTQLIGRILRQPYAKKTGIPLLDESYVFYCKGDTGEVVKKVEAGFVGEGLEDIVAKVSVETDGEPKVPKNVSIKNEFVAQKEHFYLPVWMMMETAQKPKRRFNYAVDIRSRIDFTRFTLPDAFALTLEKLNTEENRSEDLIVTITREGKLDVHGERAVVADEKEISLSHITRRLNEIIDNPFLARMKAIEWIDTLIRDVGEAKVTSNFNFVVAEIVKIIEAERKRQEKAIFEELLNEGMLCLVIADDDKLGYRIPEQDTITVERIPHSYDKYLFDDMEPSSLNTLEKKVAAIIERQPKVLWWTRNKVHPKWYAIQGWRQNKIRPDFIIAKKIDQQDNDLEIIYIVESKGEHLVGNDDSTYKKNVLDLMTDLHQRGQIKVIRTTLSELKDDAECYFIAQGDEEKEIRALMS